jgi:hypothetical protein
MKHRNSVLGFIAAVSLTLRDGDAAHAQGQGIAQEVQTYAGDLFNVTRSTDGGDSGDLCVPAVDSRMRRLMLDAVARRRCRA